MPAGETPDHPEDDEGQNGYSGPFMHIHPADIHRYHACHNGDRKTPVEQAQRQVPDDKMILVRRGGSGLFCHDAIPVLHIRPTCF